MAEAIVQAAKAAPGAVGPAPGARQGLTQAHLARRVFSEPGEAAERSAGARSVRAIIRGARRVPPAFSASTERPGPVLAAARSLAAVPASVHSVLSRPGAPLSGHDRATMEAYFGHDFAHVRIHADTLAAQSAADVHADAYSVGNNIVFAAGINLPGNPFRHRVLAHELTHVLQQPHAEHLLLGFAEAGAPAENQARASAVAFEHGLSPRWSAGAAAAGLIHRQARDASQQPTAQQSPRPDPVNAADTQKNPGQPVPPQSDQQPTADLGSLVRGWLDREKFGLPLVADSPRTDGAHRVFYGGNISTLDAVADDIADVLGQMRPGVFLHGKRTDQWTGLRVEVWTHVWRYYNEKKEAAEKDHWQWAIQVLYTPQLTFYAHPPGAVSALQHNIQVGLARNLRLHQAKGGGLELQGGLTGSLFNLGSGHTDAFQNLVGTVQAQVVTNLGHEFLIAPDTWANVQANVFAQLALGIGGSYADIAGSGRKVFIGFLAQPSAGGQVNLNIGWFQVIAQGSFVFSYLSKTAQEGSTATTSAAVQFGLGVGGQF